MNIIKVNLPKDLEFIELHTISDAHVGEVASDIDLLKKRIDYIRRTKNAYCILNGDLIDNAIIGSKAEGTLYNTKLSPMQQIHLVAGWFKPIKDKILCIQTGNHERRTQKKVGIDPTEIMAMDLDISDKYSDVSSLLFLRFGDIRNGYRQRCYAIYANHGIKSGTTTGAKVNALKRTGEIVNADVIIHSHTHLGVIFPDENITVDYHNSTLNYKTVMYVNSGTTLRSAKYAEVAGYKPSTLCNPVIKLFAQDRIIEATISTKLNI